MDRRAAHSLALVMLAVWWAGACGAPAQDDRDPSAARLLDGDLPAAEWVQAGSTWTWGHPVGEDFRWMGPGELRAGWVPLERGGNVETNLEELGSAGDARDDVHDQALRRVRLEPGEQLSQPGHLVAPRRFDASRRDTPRLILWIVADTLRADVAERDLSLQSRFDERLRFTRAYAPATWTLPSMASMFSGLSPAALRGPEGGLLVLPGVVPTVAERAREQGFVTAAVMGNPTVNHDNGFSRGFDRYTVPNYADGWNLPDATWVVENARQELDAFAGEDLFLLVHFMDAHDPYRDHESGESFVPPPSGPGAEALDADALAAMWRAYRSEARYLDGMIQQLWSSIEEQRPIDLVVFTADHGEEFLDHGGTRHGPTVLPEVSRVPLWVGGTQAEGLARRLERAGVGPETPTTLRDIGTLLLETRNWTPAGHATVESNVHGPPRLAWIDATQNWSMGSRWMTERAPGDGIEAWLRGQPELFVDPEERPPDGAGATRWPRATTSDGPAVTLPSGSWSRIPDATWLDLIEQLSSFSPGRWVFRRAADAAAEEPGPSAVDASAWAVGSCAVTAGRGSSNGPCLEYLGAEAPAPYQHAPNERRWVLPERPDRLPPEGAVTWIEAPRDTAVPQDVERTLDRLKALGYIQ